MAVFHIPVLYSVLVARDKYQCSYKYSLNACKVSWGRHHKKRFLGLYGTLILHGGGNWSNNTEGKFKD